MLQYCGSIGCSSFLEPQPQRPRFPASLQCAVPTFSLLASVGAARMQYQPVFVVFATVEGQIL